MTDRVLESPVFVVGASRSGTTLVREILKSHSELSITPETHYFDDLRPRLGSRALAPLAGAERNLVESYFLALGDKVYGQEGDPSRSRIEPGALREEADAAGGTADAYFAAFCRLRMRQTGKSRWGEKTPRHVFRISDILEAWPRAQIVCLVRDPRAVVASYRDWKRGKGDSPAADRARVTRSYNLVINALLVKGALEAAQKALRLHGPDRVTLVRYEELVTEPETTVRSLAQWLGLEYEAAMLDVPDLHSSYRDVAGGISQAPLERWRTKLSATEISVIQRCCRSPMERLGYPREDVAAPRYRLALTWAAVPVAFARALLANRRRLGKLSQYVAKRARLALSRGG